jgi:1-acyl-sn-glycerol-3-phosphate acyltransferase/long-chain acyl-CoA synthetase
MRDRLPVPLLARIVRPVFEKTAGMVLRHWSRLSVEGRENLPALPFIICSNHTSHMDSVALIVAAGVPFDRFGLLAATDYFFQRPLAFAVFSSLLSIIPIDRASSPSSLAGTLSLCRRFTEDGGHGLVIFPEGTRSRTGALGPFKGGAAFFAANLELPVIPALIEGSQAAFPVGALLPRRCSVQVKFAPPLFPSGPSGKKERERLLNEMRERILSLKAAAQVADRAC